MKKLHIGIDIDNVIADSTTVYLSNFNEAFGTKIKYEEVTEFFNFERGTGIGREKVDIFMRNLSLHEEIHLAINPYQDALDIIKKWVRDGNNIYYISARPIEIKKATKEWLAKHGFWLKGATLDLFDQKKFRLDKEFKLAAVKKYNIDIFVEDNLDIAKILGIPVLLLDMPWNRAELPENVKRVQSWEEIDKYIEKLASNSGKIS